MIEPGLIEDSYFTDILRIASTDYKPDNQDILLRIPTKGILEKIFSFPPNVTYRLFDVGRGYKTMAQKWLHYMDGIKVFLFVVPTAEYDFPSCEEYQESRKPQRGSLRAALNQFTSFYNSGWFSRTVFIILLNEIDKFKGKLASSPLQSHFPDFTGGSDYKLAAEYVKDLFRSGRKLKDDTNELYLHFTCAIDSAHMNIVVRSIEGQFKLCSLSLCENCAKQLLIRGRSTCSKVIQTLHITISVVLCGSLNMWKLGP